MEKTESKIVQVTPEYENPMIQLMEHFGWNLHGRQEMHVEGDSEGSVETDIFGDKHLVITTKVSHYVKLHFQRPLSLPNLEQLRRIEAEYFALPFPEEKSLKWPIGLGVFFLLGVIIGNPQDPIAARVFFAALVAACYYWIRRRREANAAARAASEASELKQRQLLEQAAGLEQCPA